MATLTLAQKQTLRSHIENTPALAALTGDFGALADAINANASPDFYVWKSRLTLHDVTDKTSPLGTTFAWGGTQGGYINRSQGERDCWAQIWNTSLSCDPSKDNVRTAFSDIFSGAGAGAVNNRSHIDAMAKRLANVLEKLFATGTGSSGSPAKMGVEGTVRAQDMNEILTS